MTSSATPEKTFHLLPIGELHESPHNPRRHFDEAKLDELAASILAHGILMPLLVRPHAKGYEIAAGHRRLRAAKLAGLESVPALVQELPDQAFLEILVIENNQREDVHPLEEAAGYQALLQLKGKGYDVARIAERIGRSVKYVYDRVKLLQLTKEAQRLFLEDRITAGHAILLARLKPAEQARLIDPENGRDGLWEGQKSLLRDPHDEDGVDDPYADLKPVSVRELEAHIADHVRFDETHVDPVLFPETLTTIQAAQEEKEKIVHITHDTFVQQEARTEQRTFCCASWKRADGRHDSKTCDRSVTGVIVVGFGRGEAFKVCVNKDKCRVHWGKEIAAREKRQQAAASGQPLTKAAERDRQAAEREEAKRKEAQAHEEAMRKRWEKATPAILQAVAERVKTLPVKADGFLAKTILEEMRVRVSGKTAQLVPAGSSADGLIRHLGFLALADRASNAWMGPREFPKLAKSFGLDVQKILDHAAPVEKPKADMKGKCLTCFAGTTDLGKHVCTPAAMRKADRTRAKLKAKKGKAA